jgi:hypothetical protein
MKSDDPASSPLLTNAATASAPEAGAGRPAQACTNTQVLVGLFIAWQIIFLVGSNFLGMVNALEEQLPVGEISTAVGHLTLDLSEGRGHVHDAYAIFKRWQEATGQYQSWSLFAPNVVRDATFVALEFRWDDGPASPRALARPLTVLAATNPLQAAALRAAVQSAATRPPDFQPALLRSDNEPANVNSYLRRGGLRIRKFEDHLEVTLRVRKEKGETPAEARRRWRRQIRRKVRKEWDTIMAYCEWRWRAFHGQNPDRPRPRQIVVWVRRYHIPPPDRQPWTWDGPYQQRLARWQLDVPRKARYLPIEAYDPVAKRFVFLRR